MIIRNLIFFIAFSTWVFSAGKYEVLWEKEPVEKISETRKEIVLNGIWKFMPAVGNSFEKPQGEWEYIRVPGTWFTTRPFFSAGLISAEKENLFPWQYTKYKNLGRAWYERKIYIPELNENEDVFLKIEKIYTDAVVFIDDKQAGIINFPDGEVNITEFVKGGGKHILTLLVLATKNPEYIKRWNTDRNTKNSYIRARGIVGNVVVEIKPSKFIIKDVFIKPSVKDKKLELDFTVENIPEIEEPINISIKITDIKGKKEKEYFTSQRLNKGEKSTFNVSFKWENPELWDFKNPNLYYLFLKVECNKYRDEVRERFGFREIEIKGRKFILNGKPLKLRPILGPNYYLGFGNKEILRNNFKSYINKNFNCIEPWPWGESRASTLRNTEIWAEVADEVGILLIYPLVNLRSFFPDIPNYYREWDKYQKVWEERTLKEWKKVKNHPSIIMWIHTPNFFASSTDCDPYKIGNSQKLKKTWYLEKIGHQACEIIKKYDPTRPVTTHHGANVGDVHTQNVYLNFTPLQEREEWLKEWAKNGDKPFMAIEFGTPFKYSFFRDRRGNKTAPFSEPLVTEFSAIYLGEKSYQSEPEEYRDLIKKKFVKGQEYTSWQGEPIFFKHLPFLKIQELFIKNTWRIWRTFGWDGGIPWEESWGWNPSEGKWEEYSWGRLPVSDLIDMGEFKPGEKNGYLPKVPKWLYTGLDGWHETISGKALKESNNPTLVYIGGAGDEFYDKGHHFFSRQEFEKQIIIINDSREKQNFNIKLYVKLEEKEIKKERYKGEIDVGERKFIPFKIKLPEVKEKEKGEIIVNGRVGKDSHTDIFTFRVYPDFTEKEFSTQRKTVLLYDEIGETEKMLINLGIRFEKIKDPDELIKRKSTKNILIIGKKSLSGINNFNCLKDFVHIGGRVIFFSQPPDLMEKFIGLRIARHISRRVFPVKTQKNHPVIAGFDEEDFRDWQGKGSLIPEFYYDDYYGWHFGNRGSVTSAAIEKPHFGSWRPVLECEFDLAYSPLIELEYGKGCIIFCMLDFEGRENLEPMVEILLNRILKYAYNFKPSEKLKTYYVGNSTIEQEFLKSTGLIFEKVKDIENISEKSLLIIGSNIYPDDDTLKKFLKDGGKILFLPREKDFIDFKVEKKENFSGSINIAEWEELKGVSVSDLRFRTGMDVFLIKEGNKYETTADGLLAKLKYGKGTAILIQIMPYMFDKEKTYFRYTQWRVARTVSNLISNMGGKFKQDEEIFKIKLDEDRIYLEGEWKYKIEYKTAPPATYQIIKDPGNKGEKEGWHLPDFDDSSWGIVTLPGDWRKIPEWRAAAGCVWLRKKIKVPSEWKNSDLKVCLGSIQQSDTVYFNGVKIGYTGPENGGYYWRQEREYVIPSNLIKQGENLIAIRVFNYWGSFGGGFYLKKDKMRIEKIPFNPEFYVKGYKKEHGDGDSPFRYHNW